MSSRSEAETLYGHPLQYAFVTGLRYPHDPLVLNTENLTDEQVLDKLAAAPGQLGPPAAHKLRHRHVYLLRVERYNRCPTCEQWSPCDVRRAQMSSEVCRDH